MKTIGMAIGLIVIVAASCVSGPIVRKNTQAKIEITELKEFTRLVEQDRFDLIAKHFCKRPFKLIGELDQDGVYELAHESRIRKALEKFFASETVISDGSDVYITNQKSSFLKAMVEIPESGQFTDPLRIGDLFFEYSNTSNSVKLKGVYLKQEEWIGL